MRLWLVIVVAVAACGAGYPQHRRFTQRNLPDQSRATPDADPILETVPLALAAQCQADPTVTINGLAVTVSRAEQAYCPKSDGTFALVAANKPRVGRMGLLIEPASTQLLSDVRDLSQASWTKTNMTCVKNATGADGVANSASTCTATAANATVTQAFSGASTIRTASASIKRGVGTGTISVTGNGADYCDVTSALYTAMANSCQFMRTTTYGDDIRDTAQKCFHGCGVMSVVGTSISWSLKIATSGDSVIVDFAQAEPLYWPTSPIVGASRSQDVATAATAGWPTSSGFFEALMTPAWTPQANDTDPGYYTIVDTTPTNGLRFYHRAGMDAAHVFVRNAGAASTELTSAWYAGGGWNAYPTPVVPLMRPRMWRHSWSAAANRLDLQGRSWIGPVTRTEMPTGHGTAHLGAFYDNTFPWNGWMAFPRVGTTLTDSHIKVATIGDSILDGANTVKVGEAIQFSLGFSRYLVRSQALSGTKIATDANDCTEQFVGGTTLGPVDADNNVVVYNCAINDILQGATGAATWTAAETLLNTIRAAGSKVVVASIGPCGGYATCDTTDNDTYNASLLAWCNAEGATNCAYVDANALFRDSGNPAVFRAACDLNAIGGVSDKLHPGDACSIEYANALAAGVRTLAP